MKTAIACAVLAVAAWAVYLLEPGREWALVLAVVWTAVAAAYAPRAWSGRTPV